MCCCKQFVNNYGNNGRKTGGAPCSRCVWTDELGVTHILPYGLRYRVVLPSPDDYWDRPGEPPGEPDFPTGEIIMTNGQCNTPYIWEFTNPAGDKWRASYVHALFSSGDLIRKQFHLQLIRETGLGGVIQETLLRYERWFAIRPTPFMGTDNIGPMDCMNFELDRIEANVGWIDVGVIEDYAPTLRLEGLDTATSL